MRGVNPEWANLPRRKCDDCGKSYKPLQPLRPNTRGFCSDNCRKSYHKHGGAYRKLKVEVQKMVERKFKDLEIRLRTIVHEEMGIYYPDRKVPPIPHPGIWQRIDARLAVLERASGVATVSPLPNPQPRG